MPSLPVHRVDEFLTGYSWQVALRQSLLQLTDRGYDSKKNARWHRRKLYMKVLRSLLLGFFGLSMLAGNCQLSPNVSAADLFSKIRCGTDIPKALIGGFMTNERDVSIEARHKDLGLKDLGGSELTGDLFLSSWLICGNEYLLIMDKRSIVRDVLQFPQHSKASPEFSGLCRVNGKELPEDIVAVLNNQVGAENLSAKFAWKIDPKKAKFVKLATEGMQCPRSGIITADGGN
jgi:hypothetical protein